MYPHREDVIKHIKRSLRGKKDIWHVISFNYSGYHVASKCYGTWAQRITATELDSCGGQSIALRDGSNMGLTQKACLEFFESFLNCLDEMREEERAK